MGIDSSGVTQVCAVVVSITWTREERGSNVGRCARDGRDNSPAGCMHCEKGRLRHAGSSHTVSSDARNCSSIDWRHQPDDSAVSMTFVLRMLSLLDGCDDCLGCA